MEKVNNFEILEDIHKRIQDGMTLKELITEYGGMSVYVPHYKMVYQKDEIKEFLKLGHSVRQTALEFRMSTGRIYEIRKEVQDEMKQS